VTGYCRWTSNFRWATLFCDEAPDLHLPIFGGLAKQRRISASKCPRWMAWFLGRFSGILAGRHLVHKLARVFYRRVERIFPEFSLNCSVVQELGKSLQSYYQHFVLVGLNLKIFMNLDMNTFKIGINQLENRKIL